MYFFLAGAKEIYTENKNSNKSRAEDIGAVNKFAHRMIE
jgi:hypothetical protein